MPAKLLRPNQLQEAAEILVAGGLVGFPTETVYGVAALADSNFRNQKLALFKGGRLNPFALHAPSVESALSAVGEMPEHCKQAIEYLAPNMVTVIVNAVGIRVVTHEIGAGFLRAVGRPVIATSANSPGEVPLRNAADIAKLDSVTAVIDAGVLPERPASTVVRVNWKDSGFTVLRECEGERDFIQEWAEIRANKIEGKK